MPDFDVALLSALPDAAMLLENDGIVIVANATATEALQVSPLGLPVQTIMRNAAFAEALSSVRNGAAASSVAVEMHAKPPRVFRAHFAKVGTSGQILLLLRDLTREQRIEKMRSDFVANASHEMRTPLASIMGTIETLQGAARNDVKARDTFLATMLSQAHRMKRLIDDLLTLSRIELNEHVKPNAKVSLSDIARQAKSNLATMATELSVTVTLTPDETAIVAGDADELLQVAQNLLENALKYGNAGGRVDMICNVDRDRAMLVVKDFGKGISAIHLPRLTERFYRVSTQESRARGGTGLGLAIVKHIISRHRGDLDIQSEQGAGSQFAISIPLYKSMI